jgi:hypothetical protein
MADRVPDFNADPGQVPFLRWARTKIEELERDAARRAAGEGNSNRGQNGTLTALGTQIVNVAANMQAAIDELQLDATQITSGLLDPARIDTVDQAKVTGTWDKPVATTGTGQFDTGVTSIGAYGTDITLLPGLRSDLWVHAGGTFGQTVSTIAKKMNLGQVPFAAADVLACVPFVFEYIGQVEIRDNPDNPYFDPAYVVPLEIGMMAEHLVERGLDLFVYFEEDGRTPRGINYALFGAVCALVVGRDHEERLANTERRLAAAGL